MINKSPDIVIGGPPCQGFSLAGNRKLDDSRNELVNYYLKIVFDLSPKFFIMENVLGFKSMKNQSNKSILKDIMKKFNNKGYSVTYKILDAKNYGVPQSRRRLFLVGNKIGVNFQFPAIINDGERKPFITTEEAISDLPLLNKDFGNETLEYKKLPISEYQKKMRKGSFKIYNHVKSNHTEKTIKIISLVPDGGNWKDLPEKYQNVRSYSNTWKRLARKQPSVTIDTGHRHHFHYKANRVPTVRESARIQSFPDRFIFRSNKTSQFRQVGNAVPPLLAEAVAKQVKEYLRE